MGAGRPLGYQPDEVLSAAMHAFWQRGYEATSMRDLLTATGLSKSSFYQAFGSKQEAFERALVHYCDKQVADLRAQLRAADSGVAFIENILRGAAAEGLTARDPRGCMIVNVATEFSARDPRVRQHIAAGIKRVTQVFVAAVKQAQSEGAVSEQKDANVLGRYLVSGLAGLRTMVKAGAGPRATADIIAMTMSALV